MGLRCCTKPSRVPHRSVPRNFKRSSFYHHWYSATLRWIVHASAVSVATCHRWNRTQLNVRVDWIVDTYLNQISEGIINCLIVTNSPEANDQLTRIHEHIFARELFSSTIAANQMYTLSQGIPLLPVFGVGRPIPPLSIAVHQIWLPVSLLNICHRY